MRHEYHDVLVDILAQTECDLQHIKCDSKFRFDQLISERTLKSILNELTPAKSAGCLQISAKLYLDAFKVLTEQLLFILNLSLRTRTFPCAWKKIIGNPNSKKRRWTSERKY